MHSMLLYLNWNPDRLAGRGLVDRSPSIFEKAELATQIWSDIAVAACTELATGLVSEKANAISIDSILDLGAGRQELALLPLLNDDFQRGGARLQQENNTKMQTIVHRCHMVCKGICIPKTLASGKRFLRKQSHNVCVG